VLLNVLNVPTDVLLVQVLLISVLLVLLTDMDLMIAHVLKVCMKMNKNNVNIVQIIVKLVFLMISVSLVELKTTENL